MLPPSVMVFCIGSHPWKRPEKIRVGKWSEKQIKYRQWIRVSRPDPFPGLSEMRRETLLWYHCVWPTSCSSLGQKWSKCRKVKLNSSHLLFLCLPQCVIDVRVGGGCICEEKRLQRESLSLGRIGLSSIKWDWSQSDEHRFFSFPDLHPIAGSEHLFFCVLLHPPTLYIHLYVIYKQNFDTML